MFTYLLTTYICMYIIDLKVRILEQSTNLMNNGVQHRHCHTLVLGQNRNGHGGHKHGSHRGGSGGKSNPNTMAVGPPYLPHTFSRRQHQLQQHYWWYKKNWMSLYLILSKRYKSNPMIMIAWFFSSSCCCTHTTHTPTAPSNISTRLVVHTKVPK